MVTIYRMDWAEEHADLLSLSPRDADKSSISLAECLKGCKTTPFRETHTCIGHVLRGYLPTGTLVVVYISSNQYLFFYLSFISD